MSVPKYIAGCKALGIINKIITGPLWRVLESKDVSILENEYFKTLLSCLQQWSLEPSVVISGDVSTFDDFPPSEDEIYNSFFASSDYDNTVCEVLKLMFSAFYSHIEHLVEDHLAGGKYDNITETLCEETLSVPNTNTISERDFAQLDHLLKEKSNATMLSLEALILFNNNQTSKWLNEKTPSVRAELLATARSCGLEFRKQYQLRKKKMLDERNDMLKAKQAALLCFQEKNY